MSNALKALVKSLSDGQVLLPVLMDHVFKTERGLLSGKITKRDVTVADAERTIRTFKKRKAEFNHGEKPHDVEPFHPSRMGACSRQLWFHHFKAIPKATGREDAFRRHFIFELGTYFHVFLQNLADAAGVLEQAEVPVESNDPPITGHCDGILLIDGIRYAWEIKTINTREFALLNGPKFEHKQQVMTYMHVLKLKWAVVLYFDKATNAFKEYVIRYDPQFVKEHILPKIEQHFKDIESGDVPPRISEDTARPPCLYCPYLSLCHSSQDLKLFRSSVRKASKPARKLAFERTTRSKVFQLK